MTPLNQLQAEGWEQTPQRAPSRRWLPAVVAVAMVAIVLVAVRAVGDSDPDSRLAVGPSPAPVSRPVGAPVVDPATLQSVPLEPLEIRGADAGDGPLLVDTTAKSILALSGPDLYELAVRSGDWRVLRLPAVLTGEPPETLFAVGDSVILSNSRAVVRLSGTDLAPTQLARESVALRTYATSSVWLRPLAQGNPMPAVVQIALDGTVEQQQTVPAVIEPFGGTGDLLVLSAPNGVMLVAQDRRQSRELDGALVAFGDQRIARMVCAVDLSCHIALGTLDDPEQARLPLAADELPGSHYASGSAQFSPDGRWLALPLHDQTSGSVEQTTIAILDTALGAEVGRVRGSAVDAFWGGQMAWTPDSRWLVLTTNDGLSAWRVHDGHLEALDVGFRLGVTGLLVR